MNKTLLTLSFAALASAAIAADVTTTTSAATTSTSPTITKTTTTVSTGTLHEYAPGTAFVVKESSGPVKYRYGKKVTYVTKKGVILSEDEVRTRVKVGAPVSVHFSTEGQDRIVDRVEIAD